jgi:hypothetical protein
MVGESAHIKCILTIVMSNGDVYMCEINHGF